MNPTKLRIMSLTKLFTRLSKRNIISQNLDYTLEIEAETTMESKDSGVNYKQGNCKFFRKVE